jgi:hypothetical protein
MAQEVKSRTGDEMYKPEYLQAFGLLEIEWNRIEGELFHIFYQVCGARIDKAHAIFFSQINHRARREMVEAVALYALADRPQWHRDFTALMRRVRNAASKRNEIVHTIWEWDGGEPWGFMPMDGDLSGEGPLAEIKSRIETISALYKDLAEFHRRIHRRRSPTPKSPIPTRSGRAMLTGKPLPKVQRSR